MASALATEKMEISPTGVLLHLYTVLHSPLPRAHYAPPTVHNVHMFPITHFAATQAPMKVFLLQLSPPARIPSITDWEKLVAEAMPWIMPLNEAGNPGVKNRTTQWKFKTHAVCKVQWVIEGPQDVNKTLLVNLKFSYNTGTRDCTVYIALKPEARGLSEIYTIHSECTCYTSLATQNTEKILVPDACISAQSNNILSSIWPFNISMTNGKTHKTNVGAPRIHPPNTNTNTAKTLLQRCCKNSPTQRCNSNSISHTLNSAAKQPLNSWRCFQRVTAAVHISDVEVDTKKVLLKACAMQHLLSMYIIQGFVVSAEYEIPYGWKISRVESFAGINSTFHVYNFRVIMQPPTKNAKLKPPRNFLPVQYSVLCCILSIQHSNGYNNDSLLLTTG